MNLDADWLYRQLMTGAVGRLAPIDRGLRAWGLRGLARHHGSHGALTRTWPTGSIVLWAAALLGVFLIFYYL